MATFSEIEQWLSILGVGIAGLHILKKYGVRSSELEYFVENFGDAKIVVSAFAPSPLKNQYEPLLSESEIKLKSGIEKISRTNASSEEVDEVLKDTRELYSLLRDIHQATISGLVTI